MDLDFTSVEEWSGSGNLPEGSYRIRIKEIKPGKTGELSKNPGSKKVDLTLTVVGGDYAGRTVFDTIVMEGNIGRLKNLLKALGFDVSGKMKGFKPSDMVSKVAEVELIISKGKANPKGGTYPDKNQVSRYNQLNDVVNDDDEFSNASDGDDSAEDPDFD